jgi:predicted Zn-dependent peptidase
VISGIQRNFDKALSLLEHLLANCKPNEEALLKLKENINKSRADAKSSKEAIMQALTSYAAYGAKNTFNNQPDSVQLNKLTASSLINILHKLSKHKHFVTYYGPESLPAIAQKIKSIHRVPAVFLANPVAVKLQPRILQENEVYVADFDMVQTQIQWVNNVFGYRPSLQATIDLFNSYFGAGLGSVVFQQIRESKALAYSTYAKFETPENQKDPYRMTAFIGCQADKMKEAINTMNALFNDMPRADEALQNARMSIRKSMETQRITDDNIIEYYLSLEKKGIKTDNRKQIYESINKLTFGDLQAFSQQNIANKKYAYCILGSKEVTEDKSLEKYGKLKKLTLKELFGY